MTHTVRFLTYSTPWPAITAVCSCGWRDRVDGFGRDRVMLDASDHVRTAA